MRHLTLLLPHTPLCTRKLAKTPVRDLMFSSEVFLLYFSTKFFQLYFFTIFSTIRSIFDQRHGSCTRLTLPERTVIHSTLLELTVFPPEVSVLSYTVSV